MTLSELIRELQVHEAAGRGGESVLVFVGKVYTGGVVDFVDLDSFPEHQGGKDRVMINCDPLP